MQNENGSNGNGKENGSNGRCTGIVAVHIFPAWKRGDEARVSAKFSGETSFVRLFSYFSDSLKYTESQLLGKTMEEVMDLRNRGDLESMGKR